jgi:hypothetical protein
MKGRFLVLIGALAAAAAIVSLAPVTVAGQAPTGAALRTAWGDPDLQGIWREDLQTPLERAPQFAGREFLTDAEIKAEDERKAGSLGRDRRRDAGTEQDVAGAYNALWNSVRYTGRRTSLVVDPPDGRVPALTPEAQKRAADTREYLQALLQGTSGGKAGPPSPRRAENPPYYNVDRMNRTDGPEDRSISERCMSGDLPNWGGFQRLVQSPEAVSIYIDTGQGQGFARVIPLNAGPHLPSTVRHWLGDARGRWEGNSLVVDITNFNAKRNYRGSWENLHVVERFTRLDANTLQYEATMNDPTVWTKPWTVRVELNKQSDQANRIYYEPRCHEGNYGLLGMLTNERASEKLFAEGRGPDPRTRDIATGGGGD